MPPRSPERRPPAMAGGILRPLPARGSVRRLYRAKPEHVEREAGKPRRRFSGSAIWYLSLFGGHL